ncbi:MAG: phenylalanine--tRNA ligase subunit beta, partial [Ruminococcus sp.]|nr:phenylalanine--tRNA ligase subunit beta [Ruminococcus sp.]
LSLRDMLAVIADDLKHKALNFEEAQPEHSYEHPVNLNKIMLDGVEIGKIGIVHPVVGKNIDKKANIVFAELDMNAFAAVSNASILYDEPSKFPPIDYDLSLELPAGMLFSKLSECWKNEGKEILKNTKIVDTYDTDTIHSITIRFEFSSNERTLSSNEVQEIMDKVVENLAEIGVKLR